MAKRKPASNIEASAPETKYSKSELLGFVSGSEYTYFNLALKANTKYTWNEALQAVEEYKTGGLF